MKYRFIYVDVEDNDLQEKNYEFDSLEEAKDHALNLLGVDCSGAHHIEITSEDGRVIREKVFY
ncbi:hypothetical protein [Bacteroides heparinolyticus]|uniref:hypothetical protein n=1 Tax=Prevotella heparinolytica TaxID=28113 RepID=UPI0035A0E5D2